MRTTRAPSAIGHRPHVRPRSTHAERSRSALRRCTFARLDGRRAGLANKPRHDQRPLNRRRPIWWRRRCARIEAPPPPAVDYLCAGARAQQLTIICAPVPARRNFPSPTKTCDRPRPGCRHRYTGRRALAAERHASCAVARRTPAGPPRRRVIG